MKNIILEGDCMEKIKELKDNSIDTLITDPPYHLTSIVERFGKKNSAPAKFGTDGVFQRSSKGFMGKQWDGGDIAFKTRVWKECLRVIKPGGTALIFGGSRTYHRMACAVEDAGWIIKDCIMWLYGSGFPKAYNIGKKVKEFSGWKSHGLKPAYEPIIVAMKPNEKSYINNALKYGVSGLNINGSRIGNEKVEAHHAPKGTFAGGEQDRGSDKNYYKNKGRFPANLILDEEAAEMLDKQSGDKCGQLAPTTGKEPSSFKRGNVYGDYSGYGKASQPIDKLGGASRFFYCAKASKAEKMGSTHPTTKPLKLMEYLCILTKTPTGGIVLDPFAGSGTTLLAAKKTGRDFIGIEKEKEYCEIIKARLKTVQTPLL